MRKIKENLWSFIGSLIVTVMPTFIGLALWSKLPERIAIHFDFNGNPDSYMSKGGAIIGTFLFMLAVQLLAVISMSIESRKNDGISDKLYKACIWICPVTSIGLAMLLYGYALGFKIDVMFFCMLINGIAFLILGNYMPKSRQNGVVGVRVKWTFESKKNWEHTHRFGGKFMCIVGVLSIALALLSLGGLLGQTVMVFLWFVVTSSTAVVTIAYSYMYYTKHKDEPDYIDENTEENKEENV